MGGPTSKSGPAKPSTAGSRARTSAVSSQPVAIDRPSIRIAVTAVRRSASSPVAAYSRLASSARCASLQHRWPFSTMPYDGREQPTCALVRHAALADRRPCTSCVRIGRRRRGLPERIRWLALALRELRTSWVGWNASAATSLRCSTGRRVAGFGQLGQHRGNTARRAGHGVRRGGDAAGDHADAERTGAANVDRGRWCGRQFRSHDGRPYRVTSPWGMSGRPEANPRRDNDGSGKPPTPFGGVESAYSSLGLIA